MKSICVFCGSSIGSHQEYEQQAAFMGRALAQRGIALVYGGGRVGLMGVMADAALNAGGRVVGIIPDHLWQREIGHSGLTELHVVDSMHTRKALMAERSDAFVAMPGGIGTLEEFFEVWTWGQLGLHAKPYGLLNIRGYYSPLVAMLDHMVDQQFMRREHRDLVLIRDQVEPLLDALAEHRPRRMDKWIDQEST